MITSHVTWKRYWPGARMESPLTQLLPMISLMWVMTTFSIKMKTGAISYVNMLVLAVAVNHSPAIDIRSKPQESWLKNLGCPEIKIVNIFQPAVSMYRRPPCKTSRPSICHYFALLLRIIECQWTRNKDITRGRWTPSTPDTWPIGLRLIPFPGINIRKIDVGGRQRATLSIAGHN